MNFAAVRGILEDLPSTFKRPGNPYEQVIDSEATAITEWAAGQDGVITQTTFTNAIDGWLDCWGLLLGIRRVNGEGNDPYAARIAGTILAWVGTVPAIQAWINLFAAGGSVTENPSGLGYSITLPATISAAQQAAFLAGLNRIRPAGVPFLLNQQAGGLYLGTQVHYGEGEMAGSYLTVGAIPASSILNAITDNIRSLLPVLYFVDPTLNP